jgi:acyl-CoA oxidase
MDKMPVLFTFLTGEKVALSKEKISAFCRWVKVICIILRICLSSMHMMDLQECREACGGQGLKTDNRVGPAKAEYDVQLTFEGDNNVLMQQVSKALLGDYFAAQRKGKPLEGLGLEHMNGPSPVIPFVLDRNTLRNKNFQVLLWLCLSLLLLFRIREEPVFYII